MPSLTKLFVYGSLALGVLFWAVVLTAIGYMSYIDASGEDYVWEDWIDEEVGSWDEYGEEECNIAIVPLVGEITAFDGGNYSDFDFEDLYGEVSADLTVANIRAAQEDEEMKGVLLRIDSPGGGPVASEMIANEMKLLELPSLALIRQIGTSGGYLAATGADAIMASRFSDVGSIGITMSYLDYSQQNQDLGISYVQLTSAKFKDYGSPERALTEEERVLLQRDLDIYHRVFVEQVAANRNMPLEKVAGYADGSSFPGELALDMGLIDLLGDQHDAKKWFAEKTGLPEEEIVFCE